jgi:hypothetical protein
LKWRSGGAIISITYAQVENIKEKDCGMAENERSLRQIAARVLNRDTEEGLEELDRIACGIDVAIRRRYITCATLFLLIGVLFAASTINCIRLVLSGGSVNDYDLLIVFLFGVGSLAPLFVWRSYQYGIGQVRVPKAPIYAGASKASIASLEKLFAHLQRKNAPQSYVYRRNGTRRDLNRRYYFGSLRGLLLAEDPNVRSGCLPPNGFWQSQLIYISTPILKRSSRPSMSSRRLEGERRNSVTQIFCCD